MATKAKAAEPGTAMVNWQEKVGKVAQATAAAEVLSGKFLSFKGGVITFNGATVPDLQCIIVGVCRENDWYPDKYNPNQIVSPECYAFGKLPVGDEEDYPEMVPHKDAKSPQSDACNGCAQSAWGSDPNSPSGRGKWCKEIRRLAIVPADMLKTPEKLLAYEEAYVRVPVMSVGNWGAYVHTLATHRQAYLSVVSRLFLTPDQRAQFKVNFERMADIKDNDVLGALFAKNEQVMSRIDFPYSTAEQAPPPPPAPAKGAAARKSKVGR